MWKGTNERRKNQNDGDILITQGDQHQHHHLRRRRLKQQTTTFYEIYARQWNIRSIFCRSFSILTVRCITVLLMAFLMWLHFTFVLVRFYFFFLFSTKHDHWMCDGILRTNPLTPSHRTIASIFQSMFARVWMSTAFIYASSDNNANPFYMTCLSDTMRSLAPSHCHH